MSFLNRYNSSRDRLLGSVTQAVSMGRGFLNHYLPVQCRVSGFLDRFNTFVNESPELPASFKRPMGRVSDFNAVLKQSSADLGRFS